MKSSSTTCTSFNPFLLPVVKIFLQKSLLSACHLGFTYVVFFSDVGSPPFFLQTQQFLLGSDLDFLVVPLVTKGGNA